MSASEPLMTYRKGHNVVETGVAPNLRDKSAGCLILCRRQPVLGGMTLIQAWLWNMRTCRSMLKGKRRVANTTSANTDAVGRGGVARSSVEAPAMGVERRGHGVLAMKSINLRDEGRNR